MKQAKLERADSCSKRSSRSSNTSSASKGARVVEDNMRVVRRGFDEVKEITGEAESRRRGAQLRKPADLPMMLKQLAGQHHADHRHPSLLGTDRQLLYHRQGQRQSDRSVHRTELDPRSDRRVPRHDRRPLRPSRSGFRKTARPAASCYTICPDSAISGLVHPIDFGFRNGEQRQVAGNGQAVKHLPRAIRTVGTETSRVKLGAAGRKGRCSRPDRRSHRRYHRRESGGVADKLEAGAGIQARSAKRWAISSSAITQPYWSVREKKQKGSGGLLSITVNPYTCKGCMECVKVCNDDALRPVHADRRKPSNACARTGTSGRRFPRRRRNSSASKTWTRRSARWRPCCSTRRTYVGMVGGDGACLGCGEKTVVHLFTATVEALMQPRVAKQVQKLDDLIAQLDQHVRLKLAGTIDLSDSTKVGPRARRTAGYATSRWPASPRSSTSGTPARPIDR